MIKINKFSLAVLTLTTMLSYSGSSLATDYYVSTSGNDSAQGSLTSPFQTISKAASMMVAGDIAYIRGGVYREQVNLTESGVAGSPIRFEGYQNEQVTITGTDELSGWVQHAGSIYKTIVSSEISQLFANGRQMNMARWPNMPDNLLSHNNALVDAAEMSPTSGSPWVEGSGIPSGDWTGGKAWFISKAAWGSVSTTIASKSGNRIYLHENPSSHSQLEPEAGGSFYLYNSLTALDVDDEYWYDTASNTLYFQAMGGNNPDLLTSVEARTRYYGLDFRNKSFIEIRNIDFKAANIKITGSNNILEYSKIEYAGPYVDSVTWGGSKGVELSGHNNTLRSSEISHSWGDGITMVSSSFDNVLENCLIHDVNWSAGWGALINAKGTNTRVQYNTAYNAGRTGIRHYNFEGGSIDYNNVFNYGFLTADLGGIKTGNNHALDTRISYNWVHDQQAVKSANGIYLDTGTENFTVHHNVTWNTGKTGLRANKDALNMKFYHNTFIDAQWAMGHFAPNDEVYVNVDTQNNIATAAPFLGNVLQNNIIDTANNFAFAGYSYGDFRLTSTSSAIAQASEIPGYTGDYVGLLPDAGAYEFGGSEEKSHWMPGISWTPEWNTAPVASFTVSVVSDMPVDSSHVSFDATTSTDADGTINRYFWDFGDGSLGAGQVVSHQYQDSGLYTVTLTVNDALGGKNRVDGFNRSDNNDGDRDGDGLPDAWEVDNQLNPMDASDAAVDNDNDGLTNFQEYQFSTQPLNADSDGDDLPDGWEVDNQLNPIDASDAAADNDNDGLSNLQEYLLGTDPLVANVKTEPSDDSENSAIETDSEASTDTDSNSDDSTHTDTNTGSDTDSNKDTDTASDAATDSDASTYTDTSIGSNEKTTIEEKIADEEQNSGGSFSSLLLILSFIASYRFYNR